MKIVARNSDGDKLKRAFVEHICTAEKSIDGSSSAKVSIFKSTDCDDCGGIVIRMTIDDPWFIPFVKQIKNGCEIHISGDCEASQTLSALESAINYYSAH